MCFLGNRMSLNENVVSAWKQIKTNPGSELWALFPPELGAD